MNGIKNQIGPFMYADGFLHKRNAGGKTFIVVIAGAFNAYGLIGSEHNGIAVLNETDIKIVLDQHIRQDSGYYGPSVAQQGELKRLLALSDADFLQFLVSNDRFIEGSLPGIEPPSREDDLTFQQLIAERNPASRTARWKKAFEAKGVKLLHEVAAKLKLKDDEYKVGFNPGGPAVAGDLSLHTPQFYLSLSNNYAYHRRCGGLAGNAWQRDYGVGPSSPNMAFKPVHLETDQDNLVRLLKRSYYEVVH